MTSPNRQTWLWVLLLAAAVCSQGCFHNFGTKSLDRIEELKQRCKAKRVLVDGKDVSPKKLQARFSTTDGERTHWTPICRDVSFDLENVWYSQADDAQIPRGQVGDVELRKSGSVWIGVFTAVGLAVPITLFAVIIASGGFCPMGC